VRAAVFIVLTSWSVYDCFDRFGTGFEIRSRHAVANRSHDGKKVINYAQWRSQQDFEAMTRNPETKPHMEAAAALATFEPVLCEVVDSIGVEELMPR